MGPLGKLTAMELRLFFREPITVVFTLALPLKILYLLGGVFGHTAGDKPSPDGIVAYRGFGATNWYTAVHVAVAVAGFALISAPTRMVEDRETGVLRRLRASAIPRWKVLASQFLTSLVIATGGGGPARRGPGLHGRGPTRQLWAFLAAYAAGRFRPCELRPGPRCRDADRARRAVRRAGPVGAQQALVVLGIGLAGLAVAQRLFGWE